MARDQGSIEDIGGTDTLFIGSVVVDVDGVRHCHGPEAAVDSMGPMGSGMEDQGSRHVGDSADGAFRHAILVMSIGAAVLNALATVADVFDEGVGFKGTAVGKIRLNNDTRIKGELFVVLFRADSLDGGETKLKFDMKKAGPVINKNASTLIL